MPNETSAAQAPAVILSCRPSAVYWIFVAVCAIFGLAAWLGAHNPTKTGPPSAADVAFVQTCACALLMTGTALATWLIRTRIAANADGLRWRRFGGWKSVRWEEIWDFYDRLPSQGRTSAMSAIIKTAAGDIRFSSEWASADALREQVARRATRTATREWGILGSRPCDPWPQVFSYETWANRWMTFILSALLIAFLACTLVKPILRTISQFGTAGWGVTLAMLGVLVILIFSKGALILLLIGRSQKAGQRRFERITADPMNIVFDDGARRVEAAWAEVIGYGITSGRNALMFRYVVETRQGEFDFLTEISKAWLLTRIIQRYAKNSVDREWRLRDDLMTLGGEASRWSGGVWASGRVSITTGHALTERCCGFLLPSS